MKRPCSFGWRWWCFSSGCVPVFVVATLVCWGVFLLALVTAACCCFGVVGVSGSFVVFVVVCAAFVLFVVLCTCGFFVVSTCSVTFGLLRAVV